MSSEFDWRQQKTWEEDYLRQQQQTDYLRQQQQMASQRRQDYLQPKMASTAGADMSSSDHWMRLMQEQVDRLRDLQVDLERQRALQEQADRLRDLQAEWVRQAELDRQRDLRIEWERQREWERQQDLEREWERLRDLQREMELAANEERERAFGPGSPATPGADPTDLEQPEVRRQLERLRELQEEWDEQRTREWGTSTLVGARDAEAEATRLQELQARTDARREESEQERRREAQEQERVRQLGDLEERERQRQRQEEEIRRLQEEQQQRAYPVATLRKFLRAPENRVAASDPPERHYEALERIWAQSLRLADGDRQQALIFATEAVRSTQQPGESRAEYLARLGGIPSRAFGSEPPYAGEDKPQHFFAAAAEAYAAALKQRDPDYGEAYAKSLGVGYEVRDALRALGGLRTGGYDRGDIYADDRGAEFGAAIAQVEMSDDSLHTLVPVLSPPITRFLGGSGGR